jgi:FG-GAP-like repeat
MKKTLIIVLTAMLAFTLTTVLAFASAASSAEIDTLAWNQSNIKRLRALGKHAVFRFFLRQEDPDNEMEWNESNLLLDYHWYPAGDGKYELAVGSASGPDVASLKIYWQDAPGKFRSQEFGGAGTAGTYWYKGPQFGDFNGDGETELVQLAQVGKLSPKRTKFIPDGEWPQVYRLRDGKYVEASRDFPSFYDKQVLPEIDKAIDKARQDVAAPRPTPGYDPQGEEVHQPERYLAALIMVRDKILRVLGRDPSAGFARAREWMASSDPVLVDDAKAVFEDIGGYEEDVRAATLALERASEHFPSKNW